MSHTKKIAFIVLGLLAGSLESTFAISLVFDRDNNVANPLPGKELLLYNIPGGAEFLQIKAGFESLECAGGILFTNAVGSAKEQAIALLKSAEETFIKGQESPAIFCAATVGLAKVYELRAETERSLDVLLSALQKNPTNSLLLNSQGWLLRKTGKLPESEAAYAAAIKGLPLLPESYEGLAEAQIVMRRYDEAIKICQEGVALWPHREDMSDLLVRALLLSGQKEESMKVCLSFMDKHPEWNQLRYRYGQLLLRSGRTDEGISKMREVIKVNPKSWQAYNELGCAAMDKNDFQVALVFFRSGLHVRSDCVTLLENMGACHLLMGAYDKSLEVLRQARRLDATGEEAILNMASAYIGKGDLPNALAICLSGGQSRPWSPRLFFKTSEVLCALGRHKEALHYARTGIELGKASDYDWGRYAGVLFECQQFDEAVQALDKAMLLNTNEVSHVLNRVNALHLSGRTAEAVASGDAALTRFPNSVQLLFTVGSILYQQGKKQEAVAYYKKVIEAKQVPLKDQSVVGICWNNLGVIYCSQQRWKEAQAVYAMAQHAEPTNRVWTVRMIEVESMLSPQGAKQMLADALRQYPGDVRLLCLLASMACKSGTGQERADALRVLEEKKDANAEILYWRGELWENLGQVEKAEACWQEAVRLMPGWAPPYSQLANAAKKRKAPFAEVLSLHTKAIALEPSNADFHISLGYFYLMEGQHTNAIRELETSIALNPSSGLAHYNLALAKYATGRHKESWALILKARDLGYLGNNAFVMRVENLAKFGSKNATNALAIGPLR